MISLIFAMDKNNLIGKKNDLPWHYSEDLQYFKKVTTNKTVLMGKNTFYSIYDRLNKPLPNRKNIVITDDKTFKFDDVEVVYDLKLFLETARDEEVFIIGGKMVYESTLEYADRLYITHINKEYEGDVYFPKIDYSLYRVIKCEELGELTFKVYERIGK